MKKITQFVAGIIIVSLMYVGCQREPMAPDLTQDQSTQNEAEIYQQALAKGRTAQVDEIRLKHFAKALAKSLTRQEIRILLKEKIAEKFDGDFDVLWLDVKTGLSKDMGNCVT